MFFKEVIKRITQGCSIKKPDSEIVTKP
ncbi:uncharacterized protein METZ01_LOCUS85225 [marine metagenome]|uniref:Uncharacterized protein n=1 Tax=marine metagenome TaxID=408172 RepID=A0A381UXB3_9ZZZZ